MKSKKIDNVCRSFTCQTFLLRRGYIWQARVKFTFSREHITKTNVQEFNEAGLSCSLDNLPHQLELMTNRQNMQIQLKWHGTIILLKKTRLHSTMLSYQLKSLVNVYRLRSLAICNMVRKETISCSKQATDRASLPDRTLQTLNQALFMLSILWLN